MDFMKILREERSSMRAALRGSTGRFDEHDKINAIDTESSDIVDDVTSSESTGNALDVMDGTLNHVDHLFTTQLEPQLHRIGTAASLYYIPEIIGSEMLEADILQQISCNEHAWVTVTGRRLQCWGHRPPDPRSSSNSHSAESMNNIILPIWLEQLISELVRIGIFTEELRPNNVLINQYSAHEGIMHHTDGPSYYDNVAILSLGSDCMMTFRHNLSASEIGIGRESDLFSVLLRSRSLLIFRDAVYSDYKHGISDNEPFPVIGSTCTCINKYTARATDGEVIPRKLRTSLTFRRLKPMSLH